MMHIGSSTAASANGFMPVVPSNSSNSELGVVANDATAFGLPPDSSSPAASHGSNTASKPSMSNAPAASGSNLPLSSFPAMQTKVLPPPSPSDVGQSALTQRPLYTFPSGAQAVAAAAAVAATADLYGIPAMQMLMQQQQQQQHDFSLLFGKSAEWKSPTVIAGTQPQAPTGQQLQSPPNAFAPSTSQTHSLHVDTPMPRAAGRTGRAYPATAAVRGGKRGGKGKGGKGRGGLRQSAPASFPPPAPPRVDTSVRVSDDPATTHAADAGVLVISAIPATVSTSPSQTNPPPPRARPQSSGGDTPPLQCPTCNKKFKWQSWYTEHMKGKRGNCVPSAAGAPRSNKAPSNKGPRRKRKQPIVAIVDTSRQAAPPAAVKASLAPPAKESGRTTAKYGPPIQKAFSPARSSNLMAPVFGQRGMVGASPQQQQKQNGISSAGAGAGAYPDAFGNSEMLNYMYCMPWCMISSPLEPMIRCDNEQCGYGEWFHNSCVGIDEAPPGRWYCAGCHPSNSGSPFNPGVIVRRSPRSTPLSDFGACDLSNCSSTSSTSSLAIDLAGGSGAEVQIIIKDASEIVEDDNNVNVANYLRPTDAITTSTMAAISKVGAAAAQIITGSIAQSLSDEEHSAGHDGSVASIIKPTTSTHASVKIGSAASTKAADVSAAIDISLLSTATKPAAFISATASTTTTTTTTTTAVPAALAGKPSSSDSCADTGNSIGSSNRSGNCNSEALAVIVTPGGGGGGATAAPTTGPVSTTKPPTSTFASASASASASTSTSTFTSSSATASAAPAQASSAPASVARPLGTSGKCPSTTGAMVIGGDATVIGQKLREGGGKQFAKFMKVVASVEAETERTITGSTREIFVRDHFFKQRKGGGRREQQWEDSLLKYGDEKLAEWSTSMVDAAYTDARQLLCDMGEEPGEFVLQACSMLSSGPDAEGQVPHYDLAEGCYQFIVALTENAAPTLVLGPSTLMLKDKAASRQTELSGEDAAVRIGLNYAEQTPYVCSLLDTFSNLALPRDLLEWRMTPLVPNDDWAPRKSGRKVCWSAGTMSGMRADVIHAGPPTTTYRLVLFFVACKGTIRYDADFQVNPFVLPLYLNSMCPNATLDFCGMYQDHKPWDYLGDQLDYDGVHAVKDYVQGKMSKRKAFKQLAKSLANIERKNKKKARSRRMSSKSRSTGGGRPKKRRAKAVTGPPAVEYGDGAGAGAGAVAGVGDGVGDGDGDGTSGNGSGGGNGDGDSASSGGSASTSDAGDGDDVGATADHVDRTADSGMVVDAHNHFGGAHAGNGAGCDNTAQLMPTSVV